jgi:hypothetical protein
MKTSQIFKIVLRSILIGAFQFATAQNATKTKLAVLSIDYREAGITPVLLGNYLRTELSKIETYEVMDRYDQLHISKEKNISLDDCYGKLCLVEVGKALGVDKMMTGMIDPYGETIVLTLNLIDVKSGTIEKTFVKEFLNLNKEYPNIIAIAVNEMFGKPNDVELVKKLTKKFNIDNSHNNPNTNTLALDGPRFGAVMLTGSSSRIMSASKNQGGFDGYPALFQFGYQVEKQYLTQGSLQALFEFLPMISGLDQGLFIPSLTIMHGLRSNKSGLEFAFGPTIRLAKKASGYYDNNGGWHLKNDWNSDWGANPYSLVSRMDSRGEIALETGFVFAIGCTFKSGNLNIPVNAYVVPSKDGARIGASFGFNAKGPKN